MTAPARDGPRTDTADVARLAEALRPLGEPWPGAPTPEVVAAALLPVVERLAREQAAEDLDRSAGDFACTRDRLLAADRAAALRGER